MHQINFEPVDIEMEVGEDECILDAAFRQNIHLMHGCREGQCSACKSYVLEGDIQMDRYSTFACNDQEVEDGYVLLCRAHAFSDCTIELLNFDEDELLNAKPIVDVDVEVLSVDNLTHDIVSLKVKAIEPAEFDFKPGQYADLTIPGSEDHRSFSMATTPAHPEHIEFIIRRYPGGRFSALLEGEIKAGDRLHMNGPYGSCTLKEGRILPIVAIAGGAGMSPILSVLRQLVESESTRPVRFYYGARTTDDLFYLDDIVELGSKLSEFSFTVGLSDAMPAGWSHEGVKVEQGFITDIVDRNEPELRMTEIYMCGPPPMVEAGEVLLASSDVPKDQIFFDKFTTTKPPE